jgi:hypothetical protein
MSYLAESMGRLAFETDLVSQGQTQSDHTQAQEPSPPRPGDVLAQEPHGGQRPPASPSFDIEQRGMATEAALTAATTPSAFLGGFPLRNFSTRQPEPGTYAVEITIPSDDSGYVSIRPSSVQGGTGDEIRSPWRREMTPSHLANGTDKEESDWDLVNQYYKRKQDNGSDTDMESHGSRS